MNPNIGDTVVSKSDETGIVVDLYTDFVMIRIGTTMLRIERTDIAKVIPKELHHG